jgi:hypothetical protein
MGAYRSVRGSGGAPYAGMMGGYPGGQGNGIATNPRSTFQMGPGMMGYAYGARSASGGLSTGAFIAIVALGALLVGGLLAFAVPRLRRRGGGGQATTPATGGT